MKKIKLYIPIIVLLLNACNGIQVRDMLNQIDSLVVREQYDSACSILKDLANTSMSADDQAHYYLLSTQLGYLTKQPLPSDSLLDLAILYYNKVENRQKLGNCYYYKSYRSYLNQDYTKAIIESKEAERLANGTGDLRLQYKIADNQSYLNALCGNTLLELQYGKKALSLAQAIQNKNWMAYSLNKISFAFNNLGQYDSALFYVEKTIPYINYVHDSNKAGFLTNIGLFYKHSDTQKAKEYFEKALSYEKLPGTIEHLADVYYAEGNKEKAYELWKKALITDGGIGYEKDNLIHSILTYDLERGNIDDISSNVDEIIAIKDSIISSLKNDTIKDMQLRFDHEVIMHEADKKLISAQRILLGLVLVIGILAFYIYFRKKKEEAMQRDYQMQLYAYTTEIDQLKANKDNALAQISELEKTKDKDCDRIKELEKDVSNAEIAIEKLNKNIKELLDDKSPKLKQGRMFYDEIMEGKTIIHWGYKEKVLFNYYYSAINYRSFNRIQKIERASKLSAHNMLYLILKDMGKSDDEIRRILGLSPEGLRSLRSRTKPTE